VQFVSASTGWVVGSDRILRTTDSGRTWVVQYRTSPAGQLSMLDFVDASHGWVVGASTLLATSDGGTHWHALREPPCRLVQSVHFVSAKIGFAIEGLGAPRGDIIFAGGILVRTADGGRHWQRLAAPEDAQSVCFSDAQRGWLGAAGSIYGTVDGGRTWTLALHDPYTRGSPVNRAVTAAVQCANGGAGWAELIGPGAGMSQEAHIAYHTFGATWQPIFAEQYFPHPRVRVKANAPGSYVGPFSAISGSQAVFIDACPPCSSPQKAPAGYAFQGTAPMDIAMQGGTVLLSRGIVARLGNPFGAAFLTANDGWVVGIQISYPASGSGPVRVDSRIMHTSDGGRTWQVQYAMRS
jgi:photosystem II stability/assembly factor-like uncharacterized protein